jgi:hypothetical protein
VSDRHDHSLTFSFQKWVVRVATTTTSRKFFGFSGKFLIRAIFSDLLLKNFVKFYRKINVENKGTENSQLVGS